jgi:hypothetical protein
MVAPAGALEITGGLFGYTADVGGGGGADQLPDSGFRAHTCHIGGPLVTVVGCSR